MGKELLFIPAYNCEKQISRVLDQLNGDLGRNFDTVLVINNRSTDNTEHVAIESAKKLKGIKVKVLRNIENYGLGGSQKIGFQYAIKHGFDYVSILHGDDQGSVKNLTDFLHENKQYSEKDALLGARFMSGSSTPGYSQFRIFGNRVFNCLFSVACRAFIHDLGSGLNRYKVSKLKDQYFIKFPDNLTFNYVMIMAHSNRKDDIMFFPITWRDEDQVSNVKIVRQAFSVLSMLLSFFFMRASFLRKEMREIEKEEYATKVVYEN